MARYPAVRSFYKGPVVSIRLGRGRPSPKDWSLQIAIWLDVNRVGRMADGSSAASWDRLPGGARWSTRRVNKREARGLSFGFVRVYISALGRGWSAHLLGPALGQLAPRRTLECPRTYDEYARDIPAHTVPQPEHVWALPLRGECYRDEPRCPADWLAWKVGLSKRSFQQ